VPKLLTLAGSLKSDKKLSDAEVNKLRKKAFFKTQKFILKAG